MSDKFDHFYLNFFVEQVAILAQNFLRSIYFLNALQIVLVSLVKVALHRDSQIRLSSFQASTRRLLVQIKLNLRSLAGFFSHIRCGL